MDRKYGHKGYQDSSRDDRDRDRNARPPSTPLTPEERAQQRSLRHAVQREANEVLRCPNCGRNVAASGAVSSETRCPHCGVVPARLPRLPALRFERALGVPRRRSRPPSTDKSKREHLPVVLRPGSCSTRPGSGPGRPGSSNDPKSQFDSLFKR